MISIRFKSIHTMKLTFLFHDRPVIVLAPFFRKPPLYCILLKSQKTQKDLKFLNAIKRVLIIDVAQLMYLLNK